jgi:hypothetical protein
MDRYQVQNQNGFTGSSDESWGLLPFIESAWLSIWPVLGLRATEAIFHWRAEMSLIKRASK